MNHEDNAMDRSNGSSEEAEQYWLDQTKEGKLRMTKLPERLPSKEDAIIRLAKVATRKSGLLRRAARRSKQTN